MSEKKIDAFKRINAPRIDKALLTVAMIAKSAKGIEFADSDIKAVNDALTKGIKQLTDVMKGDTALSIGFSFNYFCLIFKG